jgi:hypothetical protein
MGIAIAAVFILPDLPTNSRGFTADELEVAQLRMTEDVHHVHHFCALRRWTFLQRLLRKSNLVAYQSTRGLTWIFSHL